jgi:hypothetical protein
MLGSSLVAAQLAASQEGLSSMKLVRCEATVVLMHYKQWATTVRSETGVLT